MKVLCITDITMPGGVDKYIQQLVNATIQYHSDVELYLLIDNQKGADNLYELLLPTLRSKCIRKSIASNYPIDLIESNVSEVLKWIRPDVVHVICGWPRSALAIRELLINNNIPFFFTESLIDVNWCFPEDISNRIIHLYNKAEKVFTVSENNSKIISDIYGWPSEKIVSIPNGVDFTSISTKESTGEISRFVTVARLDQQKGLDILIDAVYKLPDEYKKKSTFTIFGEGPKRKEYERLIERYDLANNIFLPGWNNKIESELCNYDCFILPSRYEGMPIALLEAMAAKLFCIASNVSGIPEVLRHEQNGFLFERENSNDLSLKIGFCIDNEKLCREKALLGYQYVLENHNCSVNMQKIINCWKNSV